MWAAVVKKNASPPPAANKSATVPKKLPPTSFPQKTSLSQKTSLPQKTSLSQKKNTKHVKKSSAKKHPPKTKPTKPPVFIISPTVQPPLRQVSPKIGLAATTVVKVPTNVDALPKDVLYCIFVHCGPAITNLLPLRLVEWRWNVVLLERGLLQRALWTLCGCHTPWSRLAKETGLFTPPRQAVVPQVRDTQWLAARYNDGGERMRIDRDFTNYRSYVFDLKLAGRLVENIASKKIPQPQKGIKYVERVFAIPRVENLTLQGEDADFDTKGDADAHFRLLIQSVEECIFVTTKDDRFGIENLLSWLGPVLINKRNMASFGGGEDFGILLAAVGSLDEKWVKTLLEYGASPNIPTYDCDCYGQSSTHWTPLSVAALLGATNICRMLLIAGASPTHRCLVRGQFLLPFEMALYNGHAHTAYILDPINRPPWSVYCDFVAPVFVAPVFAAGYTPPDWHCSDDAVSDFTYEVTLTDEQKALLPARNLGGYDAYFGEWGVGALYDLEVADWQPDLEAANFDGAEWERHIEFIKISFIIKKSIIDAR